MRVVLYTGKGGVGKTTTAAATALCAAARGRRTLVVSADAAHSLGDVLEERLGPEPRKIAEGLEALELDARAEMAREWGRVRDYLVSLFRFQGIEGVVAEELALLPGAEELSTLLAVERFARRRKLDLVVVDCAPTDSALRLLTLPEVAHGALRWLLRVQEALAAVVSPLGRALVSAPLPDAAVFGDAEDLLYKKLRALRRRLVAKNTSVRLVVTPERMVIDEARRAHTDLCLFEVPCDAVVMNRMLPEGAGEEAFFKDWVRVQGERYQEVAEQFAPLPILAAPLGEDEVTGAAALTAHGQTLFAQHEPEAVLGTAPGIRFQREADGVRLRVPAPHARPDDLDVAKIDAELLIRSGGQRRALALPRGLARHALRGARLDAGELVLHLAPGGAAG